MPLTEEKVAALVKQYGGGIPPIKAIGALEIQPDDLNDWSDFSRVRPAVSDIERVLTMPTHAGAVDDITRFEAVSKCIGHELHMVREGRYDIERAWQNVQNWNHAKIEPPWDEDRLRNDFDRLVNIDIATNGPVIAPIAPPLTAPDNWKVMNWRLDRFKGVPPPMEWLVEGVIPLGTAGTFSAVGDAGKSMMTLQLALCVATAPPPTPGLDISSPTFLGQPITARGAAVILTAEDDANEVHRRVHTLDPTFVREGAPIYVVPMISDGGARPILSESPAGPVTTPFWETLKQQLMEIPDLKLIVLDPLSMFTGADVNDNTVASALMSLVSELATATGAAVMLIHHLTKAADPTGLKDARTAIRGGSALVDNGRWAIVLWEMNEDGANETLHTLGDKRFDQAGLVYLGGLTKGNAAGSIKKLRVLVRGASGVLEDKTDALDTATPKNGQIDEKVHDILMTELERSNWTFAFPMSESSVYRICLPLMRQAGFELSKRQLFQSCERLMMAGLLTAVGTSNRYQPCAPQTQARDPSPAPELPDVQEAA